MAFNAHAYSVSGELDGYATGGEDIDYIEVFYNEVGVTSLSNNLTSSGIDGSYANGWFEANLGSGSMKTYTSSRSVYPSAGAEMYVKSTMGDTLDFDISAGTYTNGLTITLKGTASGYILHENWPYGIANQLAVVTFGGIGNYYSSGWQLSSFSDSFSISYQLVSAGEILGGTLTRSVGVGVISEATTIAVASQDYSPVDCISDFGNSIHITSLEIPEEVTAWRSESGVFLSQPPVPIPSSFLLLGFGVLGLVGVRRRKK